MTEQLAAKAPFDRNKWHSNLLDAILAVFRYVSPHMLWESFHTVEGDALRVVGRFSRPGTSGLINWHTWAMTYDIRTLQDIGFFEFSRKDDFASDIQRFAFSAIRKPCSEISDGVRLKKEGIVFFEEQAGMMTLEILKQAFIVAIEEIEG